MVWIPGGTFWMGADDASMQDAGPVHEVTLDGFWLDRTEVTNRQFARFVTATGYVTVAERQPDPADFPGVPAGEARPRLAGLHAAGRRGLARESAGLVELCPGRQLEASRGAGDIDRGEGRLSRRPGVLGSTPWPMPDGPGNDCPPRRNGNTPRAAARNWPSSSGAIELRPDGKWQANIWQGHFPDRNAPEDGFARTAPVGSFPPNGFGLFDMSGNVWEWCSDWYRPGYDAGPARNPKGPPSSFDPDEPGVPKRVQRGGSFLCTDEYCGRYRPGTRGKEAVEQRDVARRLPLCLVPRRIDVAAAGRSPGRIRPVVNAPAIRMHQPCRSHAWIEGPVSDWLHRSLYWISSELLTHLGFLLALVFLANLLRQRRSPSSTMAWLLVILLLPYVGVPLYVIFGGRKMNPMARRKARIYQPSAGRQERGPGGVGTERLLASYGVPPAREGNRIELVASGSRGVPPHHGPDRGGAVHDPHHDLHPRLGRGEPGARWSGWPSGPARASRCGCSSTTWDRGGCPGAI